MKKLILGIAILAIAMMSFGQRQGGFRNRFGGPAALLARDDVKKDLALTDDQNEKIAPIIDMQAQFPKMQAAMQAAGLSFQDMGTDEGQKKARPVFEKIQADQRKEIDAVLTPAQSKRLDEINIQFNGNRSANLPAVQKALGLSADQIEKLSALSKAQQTAMRGLRQKVGDGEMTQEDMQAKITKNDEIMDAEIAKILTEPQKAKLKELGGKKFDRKDEN